MKSGFFPHAGMLTLHIGAIYSSGMDIQQPADGTIDMPYTFGRPVESYVSPQVHARLMVFKSKLDNLQTPGARTFNGLDTNEYSANF